MKSTLWIALIGMFALGLLLAGCGSAGEAQAPVVVAEAAESTLDVSYDGALALRNQLALGTLRLEETDRPVTAEQADELLLLWQALRGTMDSGASAQAEVDALLAQIESTMSGDQLAAIGTMKLIQADLQAWAQSQGLSTGEGLGPGGGSGQPGSGRSLSPEERATRQAERGGSGGGTSRALIDAVIGLLEAR
jgi:hypothetical protein